MRVHASKRMRECAFASEGIVMRTLTQKQERVPLIARVIRHSLASFYASSYAVLKKQGKVL